jgi:hypothetical protein
MHGRTIRELCDLAHKALKGTDKDILQREPNDAIMIINNVLTSEKVKETLFVASLDRLTEHVIKDDYASHLQVRYNKLFVIGLMCYCPIFRSPPRERSTF